MGFHCPLAFTPSPIYFGLQNYLKRLQTMHGLFLPNNGIKFVSDGTKIHIDVTISMDNEKDIKLSGKITIEETKEYAYSKIKNFCVELTSGGCKIDQFYKNGQNWR